MAAYDMSPVPCLGLVLSVRMPHRRTAIRTLTLCTAVTRCTLATVPLEARVEAFEAVVYRAITPFHTGPYVKTVEPVQDTELAHFQAFVRPHSLLAIPCMSRE